MLIAIDGGGYVSACGELYDGNHAVCSSALLASDAAGSGGSMAGSDTCGQTWAEQYDPAAAQVLQIASDLADSYGRLANLTNASLVNHKAADGGALIAAAGPNPTVSDGDHNPDHGIESVGLPTPPSAFGGTGDTPSWWHWLTSHLGGWLWPDADTGRLRSTGAAWTKASEDMGLNTMYIDSAIGSLELETSPEIKVATAALRQLKTHTTDLATELAALGKACNDYAQNVDDKHGEIEDEVKSFVEWTIGIETAGAIVGALTFGAGEGVAQIGEGAEAANAASKVVRVLESLLELARAAATAIGEILTRIGEISTKLTSFLRADREVAAVEEAGEQAAEAVASRGAWTKVSESMSERAAAYQEQITGHSGDAFVVDGVKFDGFEDGSLIDAKGPGYERFVGKDGDFKPWYRGAQSLVEQAQRQLVAADGAPITWHVAEEGAARAIEDLLADNGITNIKIVHTPAS